MSGVISSVVTNSSAMVALNSLNNINSELQTVQTAVSTGYSISSATQDGAAYAVAQSVRSNVAGLTSANQQLGNAQGMLGLANTGLNAVSSMMTTMHATLSKLGDASLSANERAQYTSQFQVQLQTVTNDLQGANYNGHNLISGTSTAGSVSVASNETGGHISIGGFGGAALLASLSGINLASSTAVSAALTASGTFTNNTNSVGSGMNALGNLTNLVSNQVTFNTNKMDALNNGVGALVDANMAQESAQLQSLQIQQQLATSALSIADQSPSLLTKLFP